MVALLLLTTALLNPAKAQEKETIQSVLDQNISIVAEDESLETVIKRICDLYHLDYKYNAAMLKGKKVNLNVANLPMREVLQKLMKDYFLIFEIEDNILVVRDYVPLKETLDYERRERYNPGKNTFQFINPKERSLTINFRSASNLIIIPVIINDSDTLNFILDTGVRFPIITELPYVNQISLNFMEPLEIRGLGEGEGLTAYRSGNNTMKIGDGLVSYDQEVQMIIDEHFQISHILGIPVHGLIGFNLFKDFVVEVDYHNQKLLLTKPEYYRDRVVNRDVVLPIHFEYNKPYIRTTLVSDQGEHVSVKLLVDTGASEALWLSLKSDERLKLPEKNIDTYLGRGLNGDLYGKKGRMSELWIGPLVLKEPIVSFPDERLVGGLMTDDRNGTLGAEVLRRFYVTIDYPNHQLKLRPTSLVDEEFTYNMSGLEISNPFPGLAVYVIDEVREGSPADRAGLRESDQILKINRKSNQDVTLNDIHLLLMSKENRKIELTVLRDGQEVEASFYLERVL